jgi:uncharacterized membrane protein YkvA (DUF1232 family)
LPGPSRARLYLRGDRDVRVLAAAATAGSATGSDDRRPHSLLADLRGVWRLLGAYLRGDYRAVRLRSVLATVVGLLYFLSPVDLIPDVFLLLGLTDDAIVASLVFTVLRNELAGFRAWEDRRRAQASAAGALAEIG